MESRVLLLMPTGRDGALIAHALEEAGLTSENCTDASQLADELVAGGGAVLVAEEALQKAALRQIVQGINRQPIWSDIPVIVFSSKSGRPEALLTDLGSKINATVVERPIRIALLISAVRGALRARQRQYQTRDLLVELEQADEQKDLFLATLSHELRTPLNSILGWIQIMRGRKLDQEATDHALEVIERNAHSQADMISDILFVSRIITGKLEIKNEPVDLADVVERVVDMIKPVADARSIDLLVDTSIYQPVPVDGDAERLQQVFLNLLANSVKFTPEGGKVLLTLRRAGSNVSVSVADTGQGINPQFLPYVFERFRQADSTHIRRIGGLGLGLAIVRHLVELHGGTVTAQSDGKDCGATFTVLLPIADGKQLSATRVAHAGISNAFSQNRGKLNGMTALVVEDDTDSRDMLAMTLRICGVNAVSVDSVDAALEELPKLRPDFLISDIGLPEKDGYQLIEKVRALPPEDGGQTPAIALTGYVSVQDRTLAIRAGYQEHLPKPVDTARLIELLSELAEKSDRNAPKAKENGHAN